MVSWWCIISEPLEVNVVFISHFCVAGVVKIPWCGCNPAHLHWEHPCKLVPIEDHAILSCTEHRGHRIARCDAKRPACRGRPAGETLCRRFSQRGDSNQESLSARSVGSARHHVSQCLQPRPRGCRSSQPQAAQCVRTFVLRLHWGHYTFLHRGKCDSYPHILFAHPPSRVQQLGLPSWSVFKDGGFMSKSPPFYINWKSPFGRFNSVRVSHNKQVPHRCCTCWVILDF